MRIRQVKPDFWSNKKLAKLEPHARLLFIGLWNMADREGRLKDIVSTIHASIFPFEGTLNVHKMLTGLQRFRFIRRYSVRGVRYIEVVKFTKHQSCHVNEAQSIIPPPRKKKAPGRAPCSAPESAPCSAPPKAVQSPPTSSSTSTSTSTDTSSSRPGAGEDGFTKKREEAAFANVPKEVVERIRNETNSQEEFTEILLKEYHRRHPEGEGGG